MVDSIALLGYDEDTVGVSIVLLFVCSSVYPFFFFSLSFLPWARCFPSSGIAVFFFFSQDERRQLIIIIITMRCVLCCAVVPLSPSLSREATSGGG